MSVCPSLIIFFFNEGGCGPSPKIVYVTIQASLSSTFPPIFIINRWWGNVWGKQALREKEWGAGGGEGSINPENNLRHTQSLAFRHTSAVEEGCRKLMLILRRRDRRLWGRNRAGVIYVALEASLSRFVRHPGGRPRMSHFCLLSGISGLSFDSAFLFSLSFFCLVLWLCRVIFLLPVRSPDFFRKSPTFFYFWR